MPPGVDTLLTESLLQEVSDRVLALLQRETVNGAGEYELLRMLRSEQVPPFAGLNFSDNLTLFRAHFILYHVLYRLREALSSRGLYHLEITPLRISLLPYTQSASSSLAASDPLRDYYGDLNHLTETGEEDVRQLLISFWREMANVDKRQEALKVLGLTADADGAAVRRRYRELAMLHHPDRGGDKEKLQELNAAIKVLRRRRL